MPPYSHNRVDGTATPKMGAHRKNKANPLLIKTTLGAVKQSTYDLPSDFQFPFGKEQARDGLSSKMVVDNWYEPCGTEDMKPARDFKALNKAAVKGGATNNMDISRFRETHDIRVKLGSYQKQEMKPWDGDTTFGRTTRPSTPFGDLVSHGFRYDWVGKAESAETATQSKMKKKPKATKSSQGHAFGAKQKFMTNEEMRETWKMKQFRKVAAKVNLPTES